MFQLAIRAMRTGPRLSPFAGSVGSAARPVDPCPPVTDLGLTRSLLYATRGSGHGHGVKCQGSEDHDARYSDTRTSQGPPAHSSGDQPARVTGSGQESRRNQCQDRRLPDQRRGVNVVRVRVFSPCLVWITCRTEAGRRRNHPLDCADLPPTGPTSVIMVGQNVQGEASDVRSQHTYEDTVQILDRLDIHTQGGIKDLADRIDELEAKIASAIRRGRPSASHCPSPPGPRRFAGRVPVLVQSALVAKCSP